jgi:hypothetical protein
MYQDLNDAFHFLFRFERLAEVRLSSFCFCIRNSRSPRSSKRGPAWQQ